MDPLNLNWTPSHAENIGIITKTYDLINKQLNCLKEETNCPDEFIYKFVGAIQKEWHSSSCQSIARSSKKDF